MKLKVNFWKLRNRRRFKFELVCYYDYDEEKRYFKLTWYFSIGNLKVNVFIF